MTRPKLDEARAAGFRAILRGLEPVEGFILVPIEVPGPDVARELAAWLEDNGKRVALIESEVPDELVPRILSSSSEVAAMTLVVGGSDMSPALRDALRSLNQRRDTIVRSLTRPLLWCGSRAFLNATWEAAPDFWSLRALTHHLGAAQVAVEWPEPRRLNPGGQAPERLRELYDEALAQGDALNAGRIAVYLAEAIEDRGDLRGAAAIFEQAIKHMSMVLGSDWNPVIVAVRQRLARVLSELGDIKAAREQIDGSIAYLVSLHGREDSIEVADLKLQLAGMLKARGDHPQARNEIERAIAIKTKILGTEGHPEIASAHYQLASVLMAEGDLPRARKLLEQALSMQLKIGPGESFDVAATLLLLANVLMRQGDFRGARRYVERSLAMWVKISRMEANDSFAKSLRVLVNMLDSSRDT